MNTRLSYLSSALKVCARACVRVCVCVCVVESHIISESSVEVKNKADGNITECSHDDQPNTCMFVISMLSLVASYHDKILAYIQFVVIVDKRLDSCICIMIFTFNEAQ